MSVPKKRGDGAKIIKMGVVGLRRVGTAARGGVARIVRIVSSTGIEIDEAEHHKDAEQEETEVAFHLELP